MINYPPENQGLRRAAPKFLTGSAFSIALGMMLAQLTGCAKTEGPPKAGDQQSAEPESLVQRGTHAEVIITLDTVTQKMMGLQVAPLAAVQISPEVKGFGRVLDPAALATLVGEFLSARATAGASQKELARLKTLAGQNNASARALEAAEAVAQRDTAQATSAHARLLAATGNTICDREDLATFAQSLASGERALVRIDLPAGENLKREPTGARLVAVTYDSQIIEGSFASAASAVEPQMQGRGFLFLVESNQPRLASGAAVTGFLMLPGDPESGVTVPSNAVVRFNGTAWVYLQTGEGSFQRTEITLNRPLTEGWFIREGLKPGSKIVTVGAQQLLSEELKGQGGEE